MGSHPTLDHHELAAETRQLDHHHWIYDHQRHPTTERAAQETFDRLNPDFGLPADQNNHYGRQAVRDREAALVLGVRVAVHDARQNDRDSVIWQPDQDYRIADILQAARAQPTRTCRGPERIGPER